MSECTRRCRSSEAELNSIISDQGFSAGELRGLIFIEECCVGADYWDDETVKRYRAAGLVWLNGDRIRLTEAGRQVCAAHADGRKEQSA